MAKIKTNGSQFKNPYISGALYILRIQYSYTQTQCEDGARDVRVLKLTPVTYPDSTPGSIKVFITFPLNGVIGASLIVSKANGVVCSNTGL